MAALRHAARRLCERALQQPGAQARSPVVAEEQRRLLLNGPSPGRRLMSTSSISGKGQQTSSAGPRGELEREFKKKKEELFDLLIAVQRAEIYPQLSWEDIKIHRLVTQLAAQVEPRPDDPIWRRFRGTRRLNDFTSVYTTVGFFVMLFFMVFNKEEDGGKNNESNIVSDGDPKNDMN